MDGVDSNRWSKPNVESNSLWQVGKNYLIPWSVHLVWMSFPCLTPLTHRSVPWWFNSLKRGSFHRIYSSFTHHLLIIYSSFTHHLLIIYLWIPIHPIGFLGGWPLQPPPVGAFFFVARHTTLPGDGGSGPALQVRGVQVWNETIEGSTPQPMRWQHWDPWSNMIHDNKGWVWVVDICIIYIDIYRYIMCM